MFKKNDVCSTAYRKSKKAGFVDQIINEGIGRSMTRNQLFWRKKVYETSGMRILKRMNNAKIYEVVLLPFIEKDNMSVTFQQDSAATYTARLTKSG